MLGWYKGYRIEVFSTRGEPGGWRWHVLGWRGRVLYRGIVCATAEDAIAPAKRWIDGEVSH